MNPFKKSKATPPADVSCGDMTAYYDELLESWAFQWAGIEFNITGIPFNQDAFDWAREVASMIRTLDAEILARIMDCLEDWPCDKTKVEVLYVDLDDYEKSKTVDIAFTGDNSWGEFGVNVIITDGKINDAYGGG
ncbi:MAG: hypothetical protein SGI71_05670 [Verrucomicrobiota bacterium]|nr:hypothetical protein [Verrucomicrobiota bacterium]